MILNQFLNNTKFYADGIANISILFQDNAGLPIDSQHQYTLFLKTDNNYNEIYSGISPDGLVQLSIDNIGYAHKSGMFKLLINDEHTFEFYHDSNFYDTYNTKYLNEIITTTSSGTSAAQLREIELEIGWNLVAITSRYGYWNKTTHEIEYNAIHSNIKNYIIDQLEDVYSVQANTLIEVIYGYLGNTQTFYNYKPGITPDTANDNFKLVYNDDNGRYETMGLWIKNISEQNLILKWRYN